MLDIKRAWQGGQEEIEGQVQEGGPQSYSEGMCPASFCPMVPNPRKLPHSPREPDDRSFASSYHRWAW